MNNKKREIWQELKGPTFVADLIEKKLSDAIKKSIIEKLIVDEDIKKILSEFNTDLEYYLSNKYIESRNVHIWLPSTEFEILEYFRKHPHELYSISSRKFEEIVASIFRLQGFEVILTPETRDGGYDLIAIHNNIYTGENYFLIECKKYNPETNKVGIGILRALLGTVTSNEKANKGILVTTSYFTKDAYEYYLNNKKYLSLNDYENIKFWLNDLKV